MDEAQLQAIASQLSCPQGDAGIEIAHNMNLLNAFITARTLEKLSVTPGETIVEIGPGNGELSQGMLNTLGKNGRYYGIELSGDMANEAKQRLSACDCHVDILHCDCFEANIPAKSIDGIMAINVLYFIDDLDALFKRLITWMKPGARVVVGVRSDKSLNSMPFIDYRFNVRTTDEIMRAMRRSGFNHVDYDYHDEGELMLGDLPVNVDTLILHGRR